MKALVLLIGGALIAPTALAVDPNVPAYWNQPREPFRVFGNIWHVGTAGLTVLLLQTKDGFILIDSGLPESAPLIAANIRKLGFKVEDIRVILNSHAHYDHAGGIAELQRLSGARVYASPASKQAFQRGDVMPDDPQSAFGHAHNSYPAITDVSTVKDGQTLRVGSLAITAHFTPGHTPGGTSWTWRSCEKKHCVNVVYADSLNSVSAPGFKFSGDTGYASRVDSFRHSIGIVGGFKCDLLLAPHPELIDLDGKLKKLAAGGANPFIDRGACQAYASGASGRLDKRIAEEAAQH